MASWSGGGWPVPSGWRISWTGATSWRSSAWAGGGSTVEGTNGHSDWLTGVRENPPLLSRGHSGEAEVSEGHNDVEGGGGDKHPVGEEAGSVHPVGQGEGY